MPWYWCRNMILALAVVLGLGLSLARHGPGVLSRITGLPLHAAWLAPVALALQVPLLRAPFCPVAEVTLPQGLFLLSQLFLLAFVWHNRRLAGIRLVGVGVLCNLLVILANGGFMPISPETLVRINPGASLEQCTIGYHYGFSKDVILVQESTRLWLLSDALVLPAPFPWPTAFSLGDLILGAGIVWLLQGARPGPAPSGAALEHISSAVSGVHGSARRGSQNQDAKERIERRFVR